MDDTDCDHMDTCFYRDQLRLLLILFHIEIDSRDISASVELPVRRLGHGESFWLVLRCVFGVVAVVGCPVHVCFLRCFRIQTSMASH
ncbi:hypothetical protein V6N13_148330 [Hibiscus sabdariffa]